MELKTLDMFLIFGFIILVVGILIFYFSIRKEMNSAKDFCDSLNKPYKFSFFYHFCGDEEIVKYQKMMTNEKYWDFTKNHGINYDEIKVDISDMID